jgi:hypothetical protein
MWDLADVGVVNSRLHHLTIPRQHAASAVPLELQLHTFHPVSCCVSVRVCCPSRADDGLCTVLCRYFQLIYGALVQLFSGCVAIPLTIHSSFVSQLAIRHLLFVLASAVQLKHFWACTSRSIGFTLDGSVC